MGWLIWFFGILAATLFTLYYLYLRPIGQYWKKRNFVHIDRKTYGNPILNIFRRVHVTEIDERTYTKLKTENIPYAGILEVKISNFTNMHWVKIMLTSIDVSVLYKSSTLYRRFGFN